jgi:serine/threonine-protein kinase
VHDPFRLLGTVVADKYRVDRVVGEGGFGVVYGGTHLLLGQPVAIKCMKPFGGNADEVRHTVDVFLREARVLFSLTHPAIVRLYDVAVLRVGQEQVPYVVLEMLAGISLEKEIERRARAGGPHFSAAEIARVFDPVLDALAFAHERGVAHRDLKPSNIMLPAAGDVGAKVLDFGTALVGPPVQSSLRRTGFTPRYAAPEQWDTAMGPTGAHTDVFALGLTLAEACALRPMFEGGAPQIIAQAMDSMRRPSIAPTRPDLPPSLDEVIRRATRVAPGERFANAREMLAAFRAAVGQEAGAPATLATPPPALQISVPPPPRAPAFSPLPNVTTSSPLSREATHPLTGRTAPSGSGATIAVVLAAVAAFGAFVAVGIAGVAVYMSHREGSAATAPVVPSAAAPTATAPPAPTASAARGGDDDDRDDARGARAARPTPTASPTPTTTTPAAPTASLGSPVAKVDAGAPAPSGKRGAVICTWAPGRTPHWTGPDTREVFERGRPGLEACYASALAIDPKLESKMGSLMLGVRSDGTVENGNCHMTEHLNEPAEEAFCSCAVRAAGRWRFPASKAPGDKVDGAVMYSFSVRQVP